MPIFTDPSQCAPAAVASPVRPESAPPTLLQEFVIFAPPRRVRKPPGCDIYRSASGTFASKLEPRFILAHAANTPGQSSAATTGATLGARANSYPSLSRASPCPVRPGGACLRRASRRLTSRRSRPRGRCVTRKPAPLPGRVYRSGSCWETCCAWAVATSICPRRGA